MIGWLLDTNVTAELNSGGKSARVRAWLAGADERAMYLSILTIGEYDQGIANVAVDDPRRTAFVIARDELAYRFSARTLGLSNAVVRRWGMISGEVRQRTRHHPPVVDTMLAATAIEHGLYLATRNMRDVQHSGAVVFNPSADDPAAFPLLPRSSGV